MNNGDSCVPSSSGGDESWNVGGYRLKLWQRSGQSENILVELGCTSDAEAYVLAIRFLKMIDFKVFRGQLQNWKGEHLMYYAPKAGWSFGDDRDLVVL